MQGAARKQSWTHQPSSCGLHHAVHRAMTHANPGCQGLQAPRAFSSKAGVPVRVWPARQAKHTRAQSVQEGQNQWHWTRATHMWWGACVLLGVWPGHFCVHGTYCLACELIRLKRHEISLRKFYAWPGPARVHLKPMSGVELNHASKRSAWYT